LVRFLPRGSPQVSSRDIVAGLFSNTGGYPIAILRLFKELTASFQSYSYYYTLLDQMQF
jgi:hypothetical protein